jgi:hypothetical protein
LIRDEHELAEAEQAALGEPGPNEVTAAFLAESRRSLDGRVYRHLSVSGIEAIYRAVLALGGLVDEEVMLSGIAPEFVASLPLARIPSKSGRLRKTLPYLNGIERLPDGTVPLQAWLKNAAVLFEWTAASTVFEQALHEMKPEQPTSGARSSPEVDALSSADPSPRPAEPVRSIQYLNPAAVRVLAYRLIEVGAYPVLSSPVLPGVVEVPDTGNSPSQRMIETMHALNRRGVLADGRVPLVAWFEEMREATRDDRVKTEIGAILREIIGLVPERKPSLDGVLPWEQMVAVHRALLNTRLGDEAAQRVLLSGLPEDVIRVLPTETADAADERLLLTMQALNVMRPLSDGTHPLEEWLANAALLLSPFQEKMVIDHALAVLRERLGESKSTLTAPTAPSPPPPPPTDPPA